MRLSSVWYAQLALSLWGYTDDREERIPAIKEHVICSAKTGTAILLVPDHFTSSFRFTQPRLPPGFHGYVMDSLADTAIVWSLPPLTALLPLWAPAWVPLCPLRQGLWGFLRLRSDLTKLIEVLTSPALLGSEEVWHRRLWNGFSSSFPRDGTS